LSRQINRYSLAQLITGLAERLLDPSSFCYYLEVAGGRALVVVRVWRNVCIRHSTARVHVTQLELRVHGQVAGQSLMGSAERSLLCGDQ